MNSQYTTSGDFALVHIISVVFMHDILGREIGQNSDMEASVGVQDGDELCCYYDEPYEDMPGLVSSSSSDALLERYLEPESPEGSDHGGV